MSPVTPRGVCPESSRSRSLDAIVLPAQTAKSRTTYASAEHIFTSRLQEQKAQLPQQFLAFAVLADHMASELYSSLDPQKCDIRLLTVLPRERQPLTISPTTPVAGDNDKSTTAMDVRCTLKTESLNHRPSYIALSYTWGEEAPSATIWINSQPMLVRENLEIALRHIQMADRSTNVWIDAICINQEDDLEKSDQVRMMNKIYDRAVEVLVWLGPAKDDSDIAMERFEIIGKRAIEAGIQDFRASTDIPNWFSPDLDERLSRLKRSLNGLAESEGLELFHQAFVPFSKRSYWTRVWVLQEMSIPRCVTLLCGSKKLDVTTFIAASNFCAFARWSLSTRFILKDRFDSVTGEQLRSISSNPPSSGPNVLIGARRRYHSETGERESLRSLLQRTCLCGSVRSPLNAKDARDKIYGLLAIASDSDQLGILPDYKKPTIEVYTDVTRALIGRGQLSILTWCQQSKRIEGLPSWVPDFSSDIREACGEDAMTGALFCASGNTEFPGISKIPYTDKHSLGLCGIKVDIIANLGTTWNLPLNALFDSKTAQRLINEVEAFCKQSSLYTSHSKALDASMRVPCADQEIRGQSRRRASSSIRVQYDILRSQGARAYDLEAAQYRTAMTFQHDRKPFLSNEGHAGLAPCNAESGDHICIIFGSTVPLILRALPEEKFRLIGEAYVYGIMDGEWSDDDGEISTFFLD